jgi:hypothetical protein
MTIGAVMPTPKGDPMDSTSRRLIVVASLSVLALGLAACGDDDGRTPVDPEETGDVTGATGATAATDALTVVAVEYEFQVEGSAEPGPAELVLVNEGEEPHELALMRLAEGRTIEDVEALIEEGVPDEPPPWVTPVGGTFARPGRASDPLQADLEAGTYLFACFVTDDNGIPHAALGMIEEFEVRSA